MKPGRLRAQAEKVTHRSQGVGRTRERKIWFPVPGVPEIIVPREFFVPSAALDACVYGLSVAAYGKQSLGDVVKRLHLSVGNRPIWNGVTPFLFKLGELLGGCKMGAKPVIDRQCTERPGTPDDRSAAQDGRGPRLVEGQGIHSRRRSKGVVIPAQPALRV